MNTNGKKSPLKECIQFIEKCKKKGLKGDNLIAKEMKVKVSILLEIEFLKFRSVTKRENLVLLMVGPLQS